MSRMVSDAKLLDGLHARALKGRADEFAGSKKGYVTRIGKFVFSIASPEGERKAEEFDSVAEAHAAFLKLSGIA